MGKLIQTTCYAKDSTPFASASPQAVQADNITFLSNATLAQKQTVPSASGSINTAIHLNYQDENAGQGHVWLIGETQTTLINAS